MKGIDEYQECAFSFASDDWKRAASIDADHTRLAHCALGIAGESGEVCELIKKHVAHGHPLYPNKIERELGDVLWYVAVLAKMLGIDLSSVASTNIEKLHRRYPDGFSSQRSINRDGE